MSINLKDLLENRFDAVDAFLLAHLTRLKKIRPHLYRCTTYIGQAPSHAKEEENAHAANLIGDLLGQKQARSVDYHDPQHQLDLVCDHITFLMSGHATYFQRLWFVIGLLYAVDNSFEKLIKQATEAGVYNKYVNGFHGFIDTCLMGSFVEKDTKSPQIQQTAKHPFEICLLVLQRFHDVIESPQTSY